MKSKSQGFSALEMLLVLSLLGVAMAILIPNLVRNKPGALQTSAQNMAEALRACKLRAIATGEPQQFAWNTQIRQWRTAQASGSVDASIDVAMRFGADADNQASTGHFVFTPQGRSNGGMLQLSNAQHKITLTVNWLNADIVLRQGAQ